MYILILYFLYNRTDFSTLKLCGFLWFRDGHTIKCPLIPFKTERALQIFLVCLTPIQKRDRFYIGRWLKTMAHSCALFSFSKYKTQQGHGCSPLYKNNTLKMVHFFSIFLLTYIQCNNYSQAFFKFIHKKKKKLEFVLQN